MKTTRILLALLISLSLPFGAMAAKEMDHSGHDHNGHKEMDHGGMSAEGSMYMLGNDTVEGVEGMAHVKDVSEAMSKMGMDKTHHFMVMFADTQNGEPIEEGTAAVKITGPDGKTSEPIRLMGMQGHFGADVTLAQEGKYAFEVGTKLPDGQKRVFNFTFNKE